MLTGEGANGKSVLLLLPLLMLGADNVSSVALEALDPTRTFSSAAMKGKFANICEEVGDVDRVAEGMLKLIVTSGRVGFERKFKDPVSESIFASPAAVFLEENVKLT